MGHIKRVNQANNPMRQGNMKKLAELSADDILHSLQVALGDDEIIEFDTATSNDGYFKTDRFEYKWIIDENTAYVLALEQVRQDLDENPDMVSPDFLQGYVDEDSWLKDLRDDLESMVADSPESYTTFIDNKDPEGEDGSYSEEQIEEMQQGYVDDIESQGVLEYMMHELGYEGEELHKQMSPYIDWDEVAEGVVDSDGWTNTLSHYDGNYETTAEGIVYFIENENYDKEHKNRLEERKKTEQEIKELEDEWNREGSIRTKGEAIPEKKQDSYEDLHRIHNPQIDNNIKAKLLELPEIKQFVDENIIPTDWDKLKIGFWSYVPFYDDTAHAIYFPENIYHKIMQDKPAEPVDDMVKQWEEEEKYWAEQSKQWGGDYQLTPEDFVEEYRDLPVAEQLNEHDMRMILHELNHYVDHLVRGEEFVAETSNYYDNAEKTVFNMEKYKQSPAEQKSFLAEIRYMKNKGLSDINIIYKMIIQYGGTDDFWKPLVESVVKTAETRLSGRVIEEKIVGDRVAQLVLIMNEMTHNVFQYYVLERLLSEKDKPAGEKDVRFFSTEINRPPEDKITQERYATAMDMYNLVVKGLERYISKEETEMRSLENEWAREGSMKSHDYDPSWDYDVVDKKDLSKAFVKAVERASQEIRANVLPKLSEYFSNFTVAYANDVPENTLGLYCNGTYTEPCIVFDALNFEKTVEEFADPLLGYNEDDLYTAVLTTIMHELGHAIQEAQGIDFNNKNAENNAEEFAYQYWSLGEVDLSLFKNTKKKASLNKQADEWTDTCDLCGGVATYEDNSPKQGTFCEGCRAWICDDCIDKEKILRGFYCKQCASEITLSPEEKEVQYLETEWAREGSMKKQAEEYPRSFSGMYEFIYREHGLQIADFADIVKKMEFALSWVDQEVHPVGLDSWAWNTVRSLSKELLDYIGKECYNALDESWAYSGDISESEIFDIMKSELGIEIDLIDDKYVVTRNESSLVGDTVPVSVKKEIKDLEDEWSREGSLKKKADMNDRIYECEQCGKQEIHKTNHKGDIYPYCSYCVRVTTWKYIRDIDWNTDEGISLTLKPGSFENKQKWYENYDREKQEKKQKELENKELESEWNREGSLKKKAVWSVWDTQTDQWMATGQNSETLEEAVNDMLTYMEQDISDEDWEMLESASLEDKKQYVEDNEFEFKEEYVPPESEAEKEEYERRLIQKEKDRREIKEVEDEWAIDGEIRMKDKMRVAMA